MFDTGNTGFMLLATSLVMLMTPGPGLLLRRPGRPQERAGHHDPELRLHGLDHGHLVRLSAIRCASPATSAASSATSRWPSCTGSRPTTVLSPTNNIPLLVFIAYQMMFAIITPALITGAFTNRVRFTAYMIFLTVWLLFVYFPAVHMIWGGGLLQKWGVLDFAGGIVVHAIAGMAALASVFFVGKRKVVDKGPHSIPLVALGTGLLWFGWYGFNAGSELRVDHITAAGLPQHRYGRLLRRRHLAAHGLDLREEAQVPRPADRLHRRPGHYHAVRRLRDRPRRGHDRDRLRDRLLCARSP